MPPPVCYGSSGSCRTTWPGTNQFSGIATDPGGPGVQTVFIAISDGTNYWDGSGFNSPTVVWLTATGTATWSYNFPFTNFPHTGSTVTYNVVAKAQDLSNNFSPPSAPMNFQVKN
jgi:hypothetical protein